MPVTIGATASTFTNPIGLLSDCHRRIDRFLKTLQTIANEKRGRPLDAEYRRALEIALKYFREAAPKHTADEEEDLFPALRSLGQARTLNSLEPDRQARERSQSGRKWHRECDEIGRRWLRDDGLCPAGCGAIRNALCWQGCIGRT